MATTPAGEEMVAHYYNIAPRIVAAIDAEDEPDPIYDAIYVKLADCVESIKKQAFEKALDTYRSMVFDLTDRYCPPLSASAEPARCDTAHRGVAGGRYARTSGSSSAYLPLASSVPSSG